MCQNSQKKATFFYTSLEGILHSIKVRKQGESTIILKFDSHRLPTTLALWKTKLNFLLSFNIHQRGTEMINRIMEFRHFFPSFYITMGKWTICFKLYMSHTQRIKLWTIIIIVWIEWSLIPRTVSIGKDK